MQLQAAQEIQAEQVLLVAACKWTRRNRREPKGAVTDAELVLRGGTIMQ
jgi:hypothetical protein